jgi:hypothetical protein
MSYQYVVVWKNRKGNQFFRYFKKNINAVAFSEGFTPKVKVYCLCVSRESLLRGLRKNKRK